MANLHTITAYPFIYPSLFETPASNMMPFGHTSDVRSPWQAAVAFNLPSIRVVLRIRVKCGGKSALHDDSTRRKSHALPASWATSLNCRVYISVYISVYMLFSVILLQHRRHP